MSFSQTVTGLINNAALLLALVVVYDAIGFKNKTEKKPGISPSGS